MRNKINHAEKQWSKNWSKPVKPMLSGGAASKMCIRDSTKTLCMLFFRECFNKCWPRLWLLFLKNFSTFLRSYLRISSFAPGNLFFKPLIVSAATAFKMFGIVTFKFHRKISYSYRAWNEIAIPYILDDFTKIIYDTLGFCDSSKLFPLRSITRYTGIITSSSGLIKSIFSV